MFFDIEKIKNVLDRIEKLTESLTYLIQQKDESLIKVLNDIEELMSDSETEMSLINDYIKIQDYKRHIYFIRYYFKKFEDYKKLESSGYITKEEFDKMKSDVFELIWSGNASFILDEIKASREELIKRINKLNFYLKKLREKPISDIESRKLFEESLKCFSIGCYKASVVMAGASLENLIRKRYYDSTGKSSDKMTFFETIEELEKIKETKKLPIIHLARIYRNLSAHPSKEEFDLDKAGSILTLIYDELEK